MRKFAIRLMRTHFFIPAFPGIQWPKSLMVAARSRMFRMAKIFGIIGCLPKVMFPVASTIWRCWIELRFRRFLYRDESTKERRGE